VISGFSREVDELCALLGYYETYVGSPLTKTLQNGPDGLYRNIGKGFPPYTALYPSRVQISTDDIVAEGCVCRVGIVLRL
jgi:hypothetical protein